MSVLDLLFPTDCAGCGRPGALACPGCRAALTGVARLVWPNPTPAGLPPPWAVHAYSGGCREFLLAYKERGAIGLRSVLAVPLAESLRAAVAAAPRDSRGTLVVPVPSTRGAIRERGDDVVLDLVRTAASASRRRGVRVRVMPALRHVRSVVDSAGLDAAARAVNLTGAFGVSDRARPALDGRSVVIADDLITTGASLLEATRALEASGARVIAAATVAATQRHADALLAAQRASALRSESAP